MLSLRQVRQYGNDIAEDLQRLGKFGDYIYDDLGAVENFSRCHRWSMLGTPEDVDLFFVFCIFERGPMLYLSCVAGIINPIFYKAYDEVIELEEYTRTFNVSRKMLVGLHDGLTKYISDTIHVHS